MSLRSHKSKKDAATYIDTRLKEEYDRILKLAKNKSLKTDAFTVNFAKMYFEIKEEVKNLFGRYYSYKYFNEYWNQKLSSENEFVRLSTFIDVEQLTAFEVEPRAHERNKYWKYFVGYTSTTAQYNDAYAEYECVVEHNKAFIFIVK